LKLKNTALTDVIHSRKTHFEEQFESAFSIKILERSAVKFGKFYLYFSSTVKVAEVESTGNQQEK